MLDEILIVGSMESDPIINAQEKTQGTEIGANILI